MHKRQTRGWAIAIIVALGMPIAVHAQDAARVPAVAVDSTGVLRWVADGHEVARFGVNYAVPFAYGYRALARRGIDHKAAIDQDVAHFARLGLDAFRIHVWDREVSDRDGNLLANVHLDLLDYLLARLAERNISVVLTPIAWWGPGYPEPDPPSPGFANRWATKPGMLRDTASWTPMARYLGQFVAHVNPYTGRAYRDEPNILAFEVINEPQHDAGPSHTSAYIARMVAALRAAKVRHPILYNISEWYDEGHGRAVCAADVQGVTAQWYPTGLVRGATLAGNMLPHVDRYPLPFAGLPGCERKARFVYEFDAADVMSPTMYPAMARSFRAAGFQWATQFAYDPLAFAATNSDYPTHFLNLVYTPAKAISLLIAAEAFRTLPRGVDVGSYPANTAFGAVRIDPERRTTVLVTDTLLAYTGTTEARPPASGQLRHIAGSGSSPVVEYGGTGAYFLDKLDTGLWRLEVYPDVDPRGDPFAIGPLDRSVADIAWRTHEMTIALPDLGTDVTIRPLDAGNPHAPNASLTSNGAVRFLARPGVYLVAAAGRDTRPWTPDRRIGTLRLGEFHAPPATPTREPMAMPTTTPPAPTGAFAGPAFDAARDRHAVIGPGYIPSLRYRWDWVALPQAALRVRLDSAGGTAPALPVRLELRSRGPGWDTLRIEVRALERATPLDLGLVFSDGSAWGTTIRADTTWQEHAVAVASLRQVPLLLLPRPYPTFLPWDFRAPSAAGRPAAERLEGLQLAIPRGDGQPVGIEVRRVRLD